MVESIASSTPRQPLTGRPRLSPKELLARVRSLLEPIYGKRLEGLVLYGSEARGEATEDSDIDVLVLLDGPVAMGRELDVITRVLYPLEGELDRLVDAFPVNVDVFEAGEFGWYRNAKEGGIRG